MLRAMTKEEIGRRRTGLYVLRKQERAAIDEAERSRIVSDEEAAAFWKRHGIMRAC
jgi:hypothetical protein